MDRGGAEVVAVTLHGKPVHADGFRIFNRARIKEMVHIIVVGRYGDNHKISGTISGCLVRGSVKVEFPLTCARLGKEPLDLIVLDRADKLIRLLLLCFYSGNRRNFMLLGEQNSKAKSDISYSCYSDLRVLLSLFSISSE